MNVESKIQSFRNESQSSLNDIGSYWRQLIVPLSLATVLSLFFWYLDQFHEIYVQMAIDIAFDDNRYFWQRIVSGHILQASLALFLAGLSIWYFARLSLIEGSFGSPQKPEFIDIWLPRFLGLLPCVAVYLGAMRAIETETLFEVSARSDNQFEFAELAVAEVQVLLVLAVNAFGALFAILLFQVTRHADKTLLITWLRSVVMVFVTLLGLSYLPSVYLHGDTARAAMLRSPAEIDLVTYGAVLVCTALQLWLLSFLMRQTLLGRILWHPQSMVMPPIIAGLLALGLALHPLTGLARYLSESFIWIKTEHWFPIEMTLFIALLSVLVFAVVKILGPRKRQEDGSVQFRRWKNPRRHDPRRLLRFYGFACFVAFVGIAIGAALLNDVVVSQALGPVAIIALFAALIVGVLAFASSFGRANSIPLIGLLLTFIVVTSVFDLGEHHHIRLVKTQPNPDPGSAAKLGSVVDGFRDWQRKRAEICDHVIVVAAQGGGHFAAYHAAATLAGLHDEAVTQNLEFSDCIFAISGISGGSVGAGLYAAAIDAKTDGRLSDLVDGALRSDLLSPLTTRLLFSDIFGNFVWSSMFDRARAIEEAALSEFEAALDSLSTPPERPARFLQTSLAESWSPERGTPPALFFNTVDVATGQRVVFTPFLELRSKRRPQTFGRIWESCMGSGAYTQHLQNGGLHAPSVLSAMFLSSRFPLVTPPGRLRVDLDLPEGADRDCESPHFIDGGAFDNSGVETARDIIEAIQEHEKFYDTKFVLLLIGFEHPSSPDAPASGALPVEELVAPAAAFFYSWRIRTVRSKELVTQWFSQENRTCGEHGAPCGVVRILRNRIAAEQGREFVLSWMLSDRTFDAIKAGTATGGAFKRESVACPVSKTNLDDGVDLTRDTVTKRNATDMRSLVNVLKGKC